MNKTINGMIYMLVLVSIALNIAQYRGVLTSPLVVKLQDMQVADVYGGL